MLFNVLTAISNKHPLREPLTITIHNTSVAAPINQSSYLSLNNLNGSQNIIEQLFYRTRYIVENDISSLNSLEKIECEFKKRGIIYSEWKPYTLDNHVIWNEHKGGYCIQQFQFKNLIDYFADFATPLSFYFNGYQDTWPFYIYLSNNINSLINFNNVYNGCFYKLFYKFGNSKVSNTCNTKIFADKLLLPSQFLYSTCYYGMFTDCIWLKTAPRLPATTLTTYCYAFMFDGCTSLNNIIVDFIDWNTSSLATNYWLRNVYETGNFYCPINLPEPNQRNESTIPAGWTIHRF